MNLNEFSKFYLNNFLDKLTEENKTVLLLGDINYLNYDQHNLTDEFLDSLSFHSFLLQILEPTRVTSNSKTLTDNNFSNTISPNIVSDNLNLSISDDVPQFLIARNIFLTSPKKNIEDLEKNWKGIKNIILLKISNQTSPNAIVDNKPLEQTQLL